MFGLLVITGAGCDPDQGVQPGAPVLTQLTILEPGANGPTPTDITADTGMCATGVKEGGSCRLVDETAPAPAPSDGGADGGADAAAPAVDAALAKADPGLCLLGAADWCRCQGDPSMSPIGAWNCGGFAPGSVVIATFDRLLDTTPFEADAGVPASSIAALTTSPANAAVSPIVDYSSSGSETSIVFKVFGPFFGNFRGHGPSIQIGADPTLPTSATVSIDLSKTNVRAKDGITPFTTPPGALFVDGSLKFKTAAFSASFTTPTKPMEPPAAAADTDGGVDGSADAGGTDGGADGGASDAATDGGASDATADAGAPDAGATDAGATDTGASEAGSDAPVVIAPPPTPGPAVPEDMNMGPVTITFNNPVPEAATTHVTMTVDGAPFTAFNLTSNPQDDKMMSLYPTLSLVITPKTTWEAGKTYVVTVDANTADILGDKLGAPAAAAFKMAN